ncbi:MAG: aminotransferase class III-fold pyridoxal phosphate-dependent enzyme [Victivallales bacterium]|nr:aminotransferase class III-fold pyridoxal phosphate-dependent enzyme [Victivallales bacterium]
MNRTQELYERAKRLIPGGVGLLSKSPYILAPGTWPAYHSQAHGCEVVDLDGKHYFDFSTNGIGSCLLGAAHPEVNEAVIRVVQAGSMSSLNPPEEVELAARLCEIHPWASRVRFSRTGGETAAVSIRIARAVTRRNKVAICGYHGWHDWYLASNIKDPNNLASMWLAGLRPYGVPLELAGTAFPFTHGDTQAFMDIIKAHGDELAAVIMEPMRHEMPAPGFLETIRSECTRHGIMLVFDEITIGWRHNFGGAHLCTNVIPDIAIFAKALGNGFPIGAVIGTDEAMRGADDAFLSSTYWTERIGPTAALATINALQKYDVAPKVNAIGDDFSNRMPKIAAKHGINVKCDSQFGCLATIAFVDNNPKLMMTNYTTEMVRRGFLATGGFYPTLAHTPEICEQFFAAADEVFAKLAELKSSNGLEANLPGGIAGSGFERLVK